MPSLPGSSLTLPFPEAEAEAPPVAAPAVHEKEPSLLSGSVRFVTETELAPSDPPRIQLFARVPALPAAARGKLPLALEEAIETALRTRGAAAPGWASSNIEDTLSDQLFRARTVGATEIVLAVGPLAPILDHTGALDVRDSEALAFLAEASRDRPLSLFLDESNANVRVYRETISLSRALEPSPAKKATAKGGASKGKASVPAPPAPQAAATSRTSPPRVDTRYRAWVTELRAARGPQPITTLERLFAEAYMPLAYAIESGLADAEAHATYTEFRQSFAKSYSEACAAFNSASKRPKMVLDAFDCAGRIARLHGARTTQLLMVDALRWDLGARLQHRLGPMLAPRATLTDEMILWSALPTRTPRQLDALSHGIGSLREPWPVDSPEEVVRGRTGDVFRRLRAGARELHKLDVVETKLHEAGADAVLSLPAISEKVAELVAKFTETVAPRTLLFVFGDHGFCLGANGASQGGASPEEVLVPGFGILVGDVN